jgi:hypothetical protein
MKKFLLSAFMVLAISIITLNANAEQARVSVPYDFVVAGQLLHAGTYIISRESPNTGSHILTLVNLDEKNGGTFVLPITVESKVSDKSKLQFDSVGGVYVLTQIQTGEAVYVVAPESREIKTALNQVGGTPVGR